MTTKSGMEWTEHTWDPSWAALSCPRAAHSATRRSFAKRLPAGGVAGYEDGFAVTTHELRLAEPLVRRKPTMFLVDSMIDIFKQWDSAGADGVRRSKSRNGHELDGRSWREMPT